MARRLGSIRFPSGVSRRMALVPCWRRAIAATLRQTWFGSRLEASKILRGDFHMRLMSWCALGAGLMLAGPAMAQEAAQHAAATATALPFDPDVATRQWLDTMDQAAVARSNSYFE